VVPAFSVIVVERMFSHQFRLDIWNAMQNLPYIKCVGGRQGSLMRFVTNQHRDIQELWLPIGSEGKIIYYGATAPSGHEAAVINCVNYMFRLQCHIFEQTYRLARATPSSTMTTSIQPLFDMPYVNVVGTFISNFTNVAFGSHSDDNITNTRLTDEEDVPLPTAASMQTPTFILGDPSIPEDQRDTWTKYEYTEKPTSSRPGKPMRHPKVVVPLNCMTLQGPGSQLYHHKVEPFMERAQSGNRSSFYRCQCLAGLEEGPNRWQ
jgi:hypothetical protein